MNPPSQFARHYLERLHELLDRLPLSQLDPLVALIEQAHARRQQIFIIGNGGSAATASHMMNDLCKGVLGGHGDMDGPRLRVIALTDNVSLLTAWANDTDYERVFSEPLRNLAQAGDLLIALSASGNSPNIVAAAEAARQIGMKIIALAGFDGGRLAHLADVAFVVPSHEYGPVEDVHLILDHILTSYLHEKLRQGRTP